MSGLPPPQLREKVRKVLESMTGYYNLWNLEILKVKNINGGFVIDGKFQKSTFPPSWVTYTITIDQEGNVIEAKIEKASDEL